METLATETKKEQEKVSKKTADKRGSSEPKIAYFENAKVTCACGNAFTTGSTKQEIHVEICNNCHPFFTGKEKFVDTEGRVERFQRLAEAKKEPKARKEVERKDERPKTLKEMLAALEK